MADREKRKESGIEAASSQGIRNDEKRHACQLQLQQVLVSSRSVLILANFEVFWCILVFVKLHIL